MRKRLSHHQRPLRTYHLRGDGSLKHLAILGPGDFLGDPDLSGHRQHSTSARVITDSVLQQIPCADMRALLAGIFSPRHPPRFPRRRLKIVRLAHSGRIVAAFSFSRNLPNKFIVENIAQSLFAETAESVLLLRMVSANDVSNYPALDDLIGADFRLRESLPKANGSVARLSLKITGTAREAEHVAALLSNLSRHFDYVLVEADTENISLAPLLEFVIQADASYFFVHPDQNDLKDFDAFLGKLRARTRGNCSDINPVICLAPHERFDDCLKLNNGSAHAFLHDCPVSPTNGFNLAVATARFTLDIRRVAREIGHCRIGLALSSGGAKGSGAYRRPPGA